MIGVGTTSYTVGSIMERLYLQFLAPPDHQDADVALGANITTVGQTVISLGAFQLAEDEALLRQGSEVQAEQELMKVQSFDANAATITVERGFRGTVPATYTTPLLLTINPPYPRAAVFEAVADNIRMLAPKLYTTSQEYVVEAEERAYPVQDDLAVSVLAVMSPENTFTFESANGGRIVDFHPVLGAMRVLVTPYSWGDVWIKFRRRTGTPTSEADTLEGLGIDRSWVSVIICGAAADLLAGKEISSVHTEFIQAVLEAEAVQPGRRMSIAGQLRQYRNALVAEFTRELDDEYGISMEISEPLSQFQSSNGSSF